MSLDVYLTRPREEVPEAAKASALLRSAGYDDFANELEARHDTSDHDTLFEANVTHNLNRMAEVAGIYRHLWRPDELGITKARELIEPLHTGLAKLRAHPTYFREMNPSNGWGSYDNFVPWVASYLSACEEYPDADVRVSR